MQAFFTFLLYLICWGAVTAGWYYMNYIFPVQYAKHPLVKKYLWDVVQCGDFGGADIIFQVTLPTLFYWFVAFLTLLADLYYESTGQLHRVKIPQRGFKPTIYHALYRKAMLVCVWNTFFSWAVILWIYAPLMVKRADEMCDTKQFPVTPFDFLKVLSKYVGVVVLTDVVFYSVHRLVHEVPFLYKHVHKIHHQWVETYGVCATACHPVEHIAANLAAVALPGIIMGVPFHFQSFWYIVSAVNTVLTHSGYEVMEGGTAHDAHHHFQNTEYGTDGACDLILRTRYQDVYPDRKSG